ncbi:hypothetical protein [Roseimaritima ulvae]|uniref:Immunity protein 35 domain-containing protein n=1 Tax=Roseimaritima ulvae TaxID=980254 RepID=A0A5B9QUK7_9BACT|nr:hypothetical protein [Roseimaritima ulvae]QEG42694.1 hypothetical protein UC8_47360 [Roseimaritima ulvae]
MARSPHRREDLLAEATAMTERGELSWEGDPELCVIGFRPTGAASIYFGEQPVLHFDPQGRLRRMFHEDQQILAIDGHLQWRKRAGEGARMEGVLEPLPESMEAALLRAVSERVAKLLAAIESGAVRWGRATVPAEQLSRSVAEWADRVGDLADRPLCVGNL